MNTSIIKRLILYVCLAYAKSAECQILPKLRRRNNFQITKKFQNLFRTIQSDLLAKIDAYPPVVKKVTIMNSIKTFVKHKLFFNKGKSQLELDDGVSFYRSIEITPGSNISVNFEFDDNHCNESDEFGGNQCHFFCFSFLSLFISFGLMGIGRSTNLFLY